MQRDRQAWLARVGELRYRAFGGAPVVEVAPAQWGLDPTTTRQAAHSRRYRETTPAQAESLRFEFAPELFAPPFDHGPGTDADRQRLAKLLAGQDQFWASSRQLRLGRDDIGKGAAAAGMTVVAEAADRTDRLLLLRRAGLPDEELRPRTAKRKLHLGLGQDPAMPWLDAPFDGSPQVLVPPPPSVSAELLGEVASLYGYFYAGQYDSGRHLLFRKTRPGLVFGTPVPRAAPSYQVPAGAPGREQWLRNHLEDRDELWVSVRHAQLSPARIAEIAHDEGLLPAAEFADSTDRILLLRRGSPVRAAKMRMSHAGYLTALAWAVLCLGGGLFTAALTGAEHLARIGLVLTVVGAPPLAWVLRAFPRSARVGWLAQEFDGSASVTFFSGQFDVSPELIRQIAAFHGYVFRGYSATTAQGIRLTYARFR
ncbi:hypothetical protein [Amycolatopsis kentuckyensis]|uniref:hypothetical protein n=1 Tax=Amycolatopsis kentuckyensis TaxID=218823 RepID=UPI000A39BF4D|nr:hypothetical protein [Amycolatopsis kentuckyensis]